MYSAKKTIESLDAFEKKEGWRPIPHSQEEVEEFKSYIDSITKVESNSRSSYISCVKPLTQRRQSEIGRWIENEQILCSADYGYFESRYAYIRDESGEIRKFKNRKSQELLGTIMADLEYDQRGVELLILSSRQGGVGTKSFLAVLHRALFVPNSTVLIGTPIAAQAEFANDFMDAAYGALPWWLVPQKKPRKGFTNGSVNSIQSTSSKCGIAQGMTPTCTYISGLQEIQNPMKVIEEGLLRAVHSNPKTLLILHGTMKPTDGWVRDIWNVAKTDWPKGRFRLCPIFIPWAICSDIYPSREWIAKYPVPKKWKPMKETTEHIRRCEGYIRSTPYLAKFVGKNWKMSTEQMWFFELGYRYAQRIKNLENYLSRMVPDDEQINCAALDESMDDVDIDKLFPSAAATQEKFVAARG